MDLLERFYPEGRFGGFSDIDGTVVFYSRINALLRPNMKVLDVGCGRGGALMDDQIIFRRELRNLRGKCESVTGIDIDPIAAKNPGIDAFHLMADENRWPIPGESIDVVMSDFVLEHVKNPDAYFSEAARVLRSGGFFCARTSNRIGYVALLAKLIPQPKHAKILQKVQQDRSEIDMFPAHYRVNTVWALRRAMKQVGLDGIAYGYEAEPSYLRFSTLVYWIGTYLHAVTPPPLRNGLFVFARKP